MLIDKPGIRRLIPHAGEMCLLDTVLTCDATTIRCTSDSHRALCNPLRRNGRLGILCGVEYAAQAMALHAALAVAAQDAGTFQVCSGYLASLRGLSWHIDRLDLLPGTLAVEAERLHAEAHRAVYGFRVRHADHTLLDGRAAVVLSDGKG